MRHERDDDFQPTPWRLPEQRTVRYSTSRMNFQRQLDTARVRTECSSRTVKPATASRYIQRDKPNGFDRNRKDTQRARMMLYR